jgi:DNA-binding CsgD family transcriptional regulator
MTSVISRPARVGLITDQTGALSFMGIANVNLAKMVTDDINARGGLLGHPVELYVEDSATDDHVAQTAAARLVREADVDVVVGGIYSSTRQAIKRPVVDEAAKLYIYPEQYEGQESHPLIFCTGPVPAQQLDPFIPWLMQETGARRQIDAARRDPRPRTRGARPGGLSRREIDVLHLVAAGRTSGEIAAELFISTRTAEHHIQNIYTKIGVSNRAAATRWAVAHRVVDGVLQG